jgi:Cys-rich repeat protein
MHCDGKGACAAAEGTSCAPYTCDELGCLTSCSTDAQCAAGFECRAGVCEAKRVRCSEDFAQSIAVDGAKTDCAPYRCGSTGVCMAECATSSDCAGGNVCSARACVAVGSVAPEEGGGCAMGSRATSGAWLVAALALLSSTRRRVRG